MNRRYRLFGCLLVFFVNTVFGVNAEKDSFSLSFDQFLDVVRAYHPIVKSSQLDIRISLAEKLSAKSAFDPVFQFEQSDKNFDSKDYYDAKSFRLNIPTWYGIDLTAGINDLGGLKTDPTETFGQNNFVGIQASLLKNLVIDKRRAGLKQAEIMYKKSIAEQKNNVNDLLKEASEAYWNWVKQYELVQIIDRTLAINKARYDLIKKTYEYGERPAIDTLEAYTQYNYLMVLYHQQWTSLQNASIELSIFLWTNSGEPYVLPQNIVPNKDWGNERSISRSQINILELEELAMNQHPELLMYKLKEEFQLIDKKLKFQELLPRLDLKYNILGKNADITNTLSGINWMNQNYQYAIKLDIPLRFSYGRGEFQKSQLKLNNIEIQKIQKQWSLEQKIKQYFNEWQMLKKMIQLQSENTSNYALLVNAEEKRLQMGESSVFFVNQRETKWIENQEKLIELKCKFYKTSFAIQWAAGILK